MRSCTNCAAIDCSSTKEPCTSCEDNGFTNWTDELTEDQELENESSIKDNQK